MNNKSKKIQSEISAGELLDKISILEIKLEKVSDKIGLIEIKKEHSILKKVQDFSLKMTEELNKLTREIKDTNLKLWNIEDKIRECEKNKDFGQNFIELARGVYFTNDKRSKIKYEINKLLKSNIVEIKKYSDY